MQIIQSSNVEIISQHSKQAIQISEHMLVKYAVRVSFQDLRLKSKRESFAVQIK